MRLGWMSHWNRYSPHPMRAPLRVNLSAGEGEPLGRELREREAEEA